MLAKCWQFYKSKKILTAHSQAVRIFLRASERRKNNPKEIRYHIQDQIRKIREKIKSVASVIRDIF